MAARLLVKDAKQREVGIHLVSVYMHHELGWAEFEDTLDRCVAKKRPGDIVMIGMDANASIGVDRDGLQKERRVCGDFGNKRVTEAGERMYSYLASRDLASAATFFKRKPGGHGTWRHPGTDKLYQIDHLVCEQKDLKRVTN